MFQRISKATLRDYSEKIEAISANLASPKVLRPPKFIMRCIFAFQGYKSLNHIQSTIFQTTYHTNENILVCAPTGAGKTNIAIIAILHE
ncbi:DExH-box ATP-dependent RNA helicase DExH14, partial [Tanacetum coccineum]